MLTRMDDELLHADLMDGGCFKQNMILNGPALFDMNYNPRSST